MYKRQNNIRPLLKGNIDIKYEEIFETRKDIYAQADLRVEINNEGVKNVAEKILNTLKKEINN